MSDRTLPSLFSPQVYITRPRPRLQNAAWVFITNHFLVPTYI